MTSTTSADGWLEWRDWWRDRVREYVEQRDEETLMVRKNPVRPGAIQCAACGEKFVIVTPEQAMEYAKHLRAEVGEDLAELEAEDDD